MYTEILELYNWCIGHSIPCRIDSCWNGYKITFPDGSDFVQHEGSYGSSRGCVEPAGFSLSYEPVTIEEAKELLKEKSFVKQGELQARLDELDVVRLKSTLDFL